MKKYLRPQLLPPLTAILGILLLLCRTWLQLGGIDEKGLYISGHTADTISFLLLGIGILGIWLCVRGVSDFAAPKKRFPPSLTGAIGCIAGGVSIVLTGILEKPQQTDIVWLLSLVTGCIACVCLLVIGYGRLKGRKPHYLLHCAVTVYFVVHLVSKYRSWSSEPQLQVFFFPLLAGVFLTLAAYQQVRAAGNITGSSSMLHLCAASQVRHKIRCSTAVWHYGHLPICATCPRKRWYCLLL